MGRLILLDSNAILDYFKGNLSSPEEQQISTAIGNGEIVLSTITRLEILSGLHKEDRAEEMKNFLAEVLTLNMLSELETIIVDIRRELRLKLPDAIIAATALFLQIPLVTSDRRGFAHVKGLEVWVPERR